MLARFLYCGCGSVFHPDAEHDFVEHVGNSGHEALSPGQVDRYIDRICQLCLRARGVKAFGYWKQGPDGLPMYSWACKRCISEAAGVPTSS